MSRTVYSCILEKLCYMASRYIHTFLVHTTHTTNYVAIPNEQCLQYLKNS